MAYGDPTYVRSRYVQLCMTGDRMLVRCDGCGRSYIMKTPSNGGEYLVGLPSDSCIECEGTTFTEVTLGSLDATETTSAG
jgi:hypothetical protein